MSVARFLSSMMMHINVEKDVKNGLSMMKYAVNHYKDFNNPQMAFFTGTLSLIISIWVEINVMLILTALPDVLGIIVRYISLASIANVPLLYFGSLVDHALTGFKGKKLEIY